MAGAGYSPVHLEDIPGADDDTQALQRGERHWVLFDNPEHVVGKLIPLSSVHIRADGLPGFRVPLITLMEFFGPGVFVLPAYQNSPIISTLPSPSFLAAVPAFYLQLGGLQLVRRRTVKALGADLARLAEKASPQLRALVSVDDYSKVYFLSIRILAPPDPSLDWLNFLLWEHVVGEHGSLAWWGQTSGLLWPFHSHEQREKVDSPTEMWAREAERAFVALRPRQHTESLRRGALDVAALGDLLQEADWEPELWTGMDSEADRITQMEDLFAYTWKVVDAQTRVVRSRLLQVTSLLPDVGDLFDRVMGRRHVRELENGFLRLVSAFVGEEVRRAFPIYSMPLVKELGVAMRDALLRVGVRARPTASFQELVTELCTAHSQDASLKTRLEKTKASVSVSDGAIKGPSPQPE